MASGSVPAVKVGELRAKENPPPRGLYHARSCSIKKNKTQTQLRTQTHVRPDLLNLAKEPPRGFGAWEIVGADSTMVAKLVAKLGGRTAEKRGSWRARGSLSW